MRLYHLVRTSWALVLVLVAGPVLAAGMTSHAMMGDQARFHLPPGHPLISLLAAHRPALIAGAMYPDGGYFTGNAFPADRDLAETAHWDGFVDALASVAHDAGCGTRKSDAWDALPVLGGTIGWLGTELGREATAIPLRMGEGCGHLVAFMMGVAAHGMGDEVWDALFEPSVYQRNEMQDGRQTTSPGYTLDSVPPGASPTVGVALRAALGDQAFDALSEGFKVINGVEYAMDVIAIRDQFAWAEVPALVFPPTAYLLEAYKRHGKTFDTAAVERAALGTRLVVAAERIGAALDYMRVRDQMPYAVHNYMAGSGGIQDTAQYIAGYYEHLWDRIVNGPDKAMRPFVVGVHPRPGERGLPATACETEGGSPFGNCLDDKRPIADRYIYVSLSGSMGSNYAELKDPFAVFDEAGNKLPVKFTQLPPWGSPKDAHGFRIELLDKKLKPNHRYTVVVTTQLYDRRGPGDPKASLAAPMIWHFSTGAE
jgi:hypothetical protein